jgi:hypothetical protein
VDEVALHYDLPPDLLLVMGWVGSSWSEPDPEHGEVAPSFGPLALSAEQVDLAAELTGLSALTISADPSASFVAGAALLDALRNQHAPGADSLFFDARWWPVLMAWSGTGEDWLDAMYTWDVFAILQRGLSAETHLGEPIFVAPRLIQGLQAIDLPQAPDDGGERHESDSGAGYPGRAQFIPAHYSNFGNSRSGGLGAIDMVVIHTVEGSFSAAVGWFRDPVSDVSAHYVVRRSDGEITQMVYDEVRAWHAGSVNTRSIGIEHEGIAANASNWTNAMLESSARLSAWLSDSYDIPVDRAHFVAHSEVPGAARSDPGPYFPWDLYLDLVVCFKSGSADCAGGSGTSSGGPSEPPAGPEGPVDPSPAGPSCSGSDAHEGSGDGGGSPSEPSAPTEWVRIIHPTHGMPVGDPTEIVARRGGGDRIEFWAGAALLGEALASNPAITSVDFASHGNRTIMARLLSPWGAVLATDTVRVEVQAAEGSIRPYGSPAGGLRWTIGSAAEDLGDVAYVTYSVDGFTLSDDNSGEVELSGPDFVLTYTFETTGHARVLVARAYDASGDFLAHGVSYIDVEEATEIECAIRDTLTCGQVVTGNTLLDSSATDHLASYAGIVGIWSGPEVGYALAAAPVGGIELELLYDGPIEIDHDLILLKRDVGVCAAADAIQVGYTSLSFTPEAGASYTLVVDGYNGDAGEYSVRMTCL